MNLLFSAITYSSILGHGTAEQCNAAEARLLRAAVAFHAAIETLDAKPRPARTRKRTGKETSK
jgi:hypothetical protein